MRSWNFRGLMAVALTVAMVFVTMPLSAADLATTRPVIGSVSAVGSVELRGVGISQEGTLFSGDSIRANAKGYAKVLIGTGSKIELQEKTDIRINRDAKGIQIAMNSGLVGFTARTPLRIDVAPFEVTASDDASGNVAMMTTETAGVRAINGKVTVRNLKTSESFVLTKGQEEVLGLKDGAHAPSLGQIATNVPAPVPAPTPAPAPQTPAGQTSGGFKMDTGGWLAVIGGAAVAGIAIWGVVEAHNNKNDINSLEQQIAAANQNIAINSVNIANNNAALQAELKATQAAFSASTTTSQAATAAAQVSTATAQVQAAITSSNLSAAAKASLTTQATAVQSNITSLASTISQLQNQLQALTTQLQGATGTQVQAIQNQINTVTSNLNSSVTTLNQQIAALNTLIQSANSQGVQGVPNVTIQPVTPAPVSSASVPA